MAKALFLDRDGIINFDYGYVHSSDNCIFMPGIFQICRFFKSRGYQLVIITNQAGIARGYFSEVQFFSFTSWMMRQFVNEGIEISGVYYCPHHPISGIGKYKTYCDCRKPNPGLLFEAERDLQLDLTSSYLIGDKLSDVQAADAAGLKGSWLIGTQYVAEPDFESLDSFISYLEENF